MSKYHRRNDGKSLCCLLAPAAFVLCALVASSTLVLASEENDEFRRGLVAEFSQVASSQRNGPSFQRVDARPIVVARAIPADERLPANRAFRVRWTGLLETDGDGQYRFAAWVCGTVKMTLGDQVVLEGKRGTAGWIVGPRVSLPYDWLPVVVEYEAPREGGELRWFWEGPEFELEPIPPRVYSHPTNESVGSTFEQGRELMRAWRCASCHGISVDRIPGPSLHYARDTLQPGYVIDRLMQRLPSGGENAAGKENRHMPYYGLSREDAEAVVAFLWSRSQRIPKPQQPWRAAPHSSKKQKPPPSLSEYRRTGERLVHSLGCLACHRVQGLGYASWSDGPDLDDVGEKRPKGFVLRWLQDPAVLQPSHRMPRFDLTRSEARAVAAWLERPKAPEAGSPAAEASPLPRMSSERIRRGKQLVAELRCTACHSVSGVPSPKELPAPARWDAAASCVQGKSNRRIAIPLTDRQVTQIRQYLAERKSEVPLGADGRQVLERRGCVHCHRRDPWPGLAPIASQVGERIPDLASRVPAMTPPPLDTVGDKLKDEALRAAIERKHETLRSYLDVRMPSYRFEPGEVDALLDVLVAEDRIPPGYPAARRQKTLEVDDVTLMAAGARLVTSDGFGCTSCHQVGGVMPAAAPLNARGPELTQPGKRIREEWFLRWVRNPSRMVPRMEMPGVKLAVRGVLHDNLDHQLEAIWRVLNRPDFVPPTPNPIRIVRQSGLRDTKQPRAVFLTDVLRRGSAQWIKPLLIGLPNRHNVLFDLESGRMIAWTTGDTARQRTEGKRWFWELGGAALWQASGADAEIELRKGTTRLVPERRGQFVTEFDVVEHTTGGGLDVAYRLHVTTPEGKPHQLHVRQHWQPVFAGSAGEGFDRTVAIEGAPPGWQIMFRAFPSARDVRFSGDGKSLSLPGPARVTVAVKQGQVSRSGRDGWLLLGGSATLAYRAKVGVDRFPYESTHEVALEPQELNVLPGFVTTRLAFPEEIMPTAIGWLPNGVLAFTSLKGRVWMAADRDGDGLEEALWPASDELAAPYGLFAGDGYVDVINKYALLRLTDLDADGRFDKYETVASGWGHTADYHDWAVGLPRDEHGAYFVALPCQQDERSEAAAKYRGRVLRLVPRMPTRDNPRRYDIEVVSGGHRFPMGIARNRRGELYVTDNQGNYNPFNELNLVMRGKRYGFYNALEKKKGLHFSATPPAVKIPHPWTRSVNGICFLESPPMSAPRAFGPFEGDLVGCEFNERLLIRISLERINGRVQGAVYPFTWRTPPSGPPLLGPIACAVSPRGELYIGCLRDSGWGGANNIGSVVQCRPDFERLPTGIARVKIVDGGFRFVFTRPVDPRRAADKSLYRVSSYTRISTPAYGGPDVDRSVEEVQSVDVDRSGRAVTIKLSRPFKRGYVYELHVERKLVPEGESFFPQEAYYTVWESPQDAKDAGSPDR